MENPHDQENMEASHETTSKNHHNNHQTKKSSGKKDKSADGFTTFLKDVERLGDRYLVREAPFSLPKSVKDVIVKNYTLGKGLTISIAVAVTICILVTEIAGVFTFSLASLLYLFAFILTVQGFSAFAKKQYYGRERMFWTYLLVILASIISAPYFGGIIGGIIGGVISLYFLFQIKEYYK